MMKRTSLVATMTVVLATFALSGCAASQISSNADTLTKILGTHLNVTAKQAKGGAGSILSFAKEKLPSGDFDSLTKYISGSDDLMKSANDLKAVTGSINDKAGLENAFNKLGMEGNMIPKFSKTMGDFVGNSGGDAVKKFFGSLM